MNSPAIEFWQSRKCYYYSKYQQQGRYSAIWQAKFCWVIYRIHQLNQLEADD